jgi:predicted site-specific integrase-resolvase
MISLERAACALDIGRSTAYRDAKSGDFPVPVKKVGKQYRVPTAPLLEFLGLISKRGPAATETQA